jgi:hypothetical protein
MTRSPSNDRGDRRVRSAIILMLVFCVVYLVILLPFSKQGAAIGGAITALAGLIAVVIGVGASKRP